MIAKTYSATVLGIDAYLIEVEVDVSVGMSVFNIVGLPDGTIKESRDRILSAVNNSGYSFPVRRVVVNLAPASLRKIGSGFDLPIALALLGTMGLFPPENLSRAMVVGELSLDGEIRPVRGILPVAVAAREHELEQLILPKANESEAAVVEGIRRVPVSTLYEVVKYLKGDLQITPLDYDPAEIFSQQQHFEEDFQDVKGQEHVKRALEVAASGSHNLLMLGPPGSGKTMLARRMSTILPRLSFDEALECTKIHSIAGKLSSGTSLIAQRPFRFPHHTISQAGLVGGGGIPGPGEISLSHNGVLFLDEFPEFPRATLELLRQPLEDGKLTISRAAMSLEFPCDFMLLASMNPCPCGYHGAPSGHGRNRRECNCAPQLIQKYRAKISGPLLDRIDIHLTVPAVEYEKLAEARVGESSKNIRERVVRARQVQEKRFQNSSSRNNSGMNRKELETHAELADSSRKILQQAMTKMGLSARAYDRILKVARTIADLAGEQKIDTPHVAEAIQYRNLDRPV
ncbi:MAG: YifB family Mg chelatase-like AAA ATPase [Deltaproteobacteria bacterium]|nr:YifB family Mg chelatase-like AAA ATPase [Deltaproteobacteria bacterium]